MKAILELEMPENCNVCPLCSNIFNKERNTVFYEGRCEATHKYHCGIKESRAPFCPLKDIEKEAAQ